MSNRTFISAEQISALCDGQLDDAHFTQTVAGVLSDADAQKTWLSYHVIGDVMRSADLASDACDADFLKRFEQRLASAPGISVVPKPVGDVGGIPIGVREMPHGIATEGANASVYRWKALAGVLSTAAFSLVGLGLWYQSSSTLSHVSSGPQVRTDSAPLVAANINETPVMLRDPRLDELLAAHRQVAGYSALQVPAGFLRNATYEGSGR